MTKKAEPKNHLRPSHWTCLLLSPPIFNFLHLFQWFPPIPMVSTYPQLSPPIPMISTYSNGSVSCLFPLAFTSCPTRWSLFYIDHWLSTERQGTVLYYPGLIFTSSSLQFAFSLIRSCSLSVAKSHQKLQLWSTTLKCELWTLNWDKLNTLRKVHLI